MNLVNTLNHHWYKTSLLPQVVLKHVVSRDFILKILCVGPVLYPAKSEEIYGTALYLIFPCYFTLLNQASAGHRPVRAWFLNIDPV